MIFLGKNLTIKKGDVDMFETIVGNIVIWGSIVAFGTLCFYMVLHRGTKKDVGATTKIKVRGKEYILLLVEEDDGWIFAAFDVSARRRIERNIYRTYKEAKRAKKAFINRIFG